ncbi:bifunctional glutamate--cysteine ligase GshA/glutathione synthetase GshB [Vaginisenegalia massiliensis]|uniref:bifunctional glutamate--cysteine ligase GshA/glutathione synthetase GshB n=1 Tax=Vaginisenegalia massiliensis TaxID=2058294 RepID=UPI000F546786|nr:bifunctional glutamate--cysteine ligase GshA/glutathione synthetase GshB [Vaginisenegalia massiliensis]
MNTTTKLFNKDHLAALWQSTIGLEKESLRLDPSGQLSQQEHSKSWGSRSYQPYIQTDFAEAQLELITPPCSSSHDVLNWLASIHQIVGSTVSDQGELLWPFSMPLHLPQDIETMKVAQLEKESERAYREQLAQNYGKKVQLISGIHYNLQLNPLIMDQVITSDSKTSSIEANNQIYMHLARNFLRYRWILTHLLSSSPLAPSEYETQYYGTPHQQPMKSVRQSRYGYRNHSDVTVSYESLPQFVESLEQQVAKGNLSLEKELYRDVRLRGAKSARGLLTHGIQYIEFRNFDLNPYQPYGMSQADIDFVKLFILSLLYIEDCRTDQAIDFGNDLHLATAESHPGDTCQDKDEALAILELVRDNARLLDNIYYPDHYLEKLVADKLAEIKGEKPILAQRVFHDFPDLATWHTSGLELARQHLDRYLTKAYTLHGFEALEISSQDLVKQAIRLGIQVKVLDANENLLEFDYLGHKEFVKNGNMTRLDSLISYYLMENKVATKELLARQGLHVPSGSSFSSAQAAKAFYHQLPFDRFVIKPKNTNYGLGISIFKSKPNQDLFNQAVDNALAEDQTVLVEEYIEGTELRFYVQNQEVKAVLERQPAHVIGDGHHTIGQLIDIENESQPLRGPKHHAPLTQLAKGTTEQIQLSNQGYDFDSVPKVGEKVLLRENSNISTGGVSIDRTQDVHPDYLKLAQEAAKALGANFCGVDIIIKDYRQAVHSTTDYGIIEANFNPAMMIHLFPGQGQAQPLSLYVLQQLYPEYPWQKN